MKAQPERGFKLRNSSSTFPPPLYTLALHSSPAPPADPLPAAATAVAETGKRKRETVAEVTEEAEGVELGGSGIENEEKEKEKKRRKISDAVWKTMTRGQRKNYMRRHKR